MNQEEVFKKIMEQFVSGEITSESRIILLSMFDNSKYSEELNKILRENYDSVEIPQQSSEENEKFIKTKN